MPRTVVSAVGAAISLVLRSMEAPRDAERAQFFLTMLDGAGKLSHDCRDA
jgi:hypothetical protein